MVDFRIPSPTPQKKTGVSVTVQLYNKYYIYIYIFQNTTGKVDANPLSQRSMKRDSTLYFLYTKHVTLAILYSA